MLQLLQFTFVWSKFITFTEKYPVDFSQYIAELLEEHDYVIVPGLGAFKASHRPARFDESGKKLMPPAKVLSFNQELKLNDGLLSGFLVHRLKISVSRAQKLTGEFSDDVVFRLGQGEMVELEGLGNLVSVAGNIKFSPAGSSSDTAGSFGLEPVAISLPGTNHTEDEVDPGGKGDEWIAETNRAEEVVPGEAVTGLVAANDQGETVEPEGKVAGLVAASGPEKQDDREVTSNLGEQVNPVAKTSRPVIWIVLIIILAFLAAVWFLFFHTRQDSEASKPPQMATPVAPTPGPATADSMVTTSEPVGKDSVSAIHVAPSPGDLYFMVGGSFRSQQNADQYFTKMSAKGFHPVHLGQLGSYFLVAIDSFKTEREAVSAINDYNDRFPDAGAWVFHRKQK